MQANAHRGEVALALGEGYVLRPSFEALSRIEQQLDTGIFALARKLAAGQMTLEELATIIAQCAQVEPQRVQEALMCEGIAPAQRAVALLLTRVLEGFHAE